MDGKGKGKPRGQKSGSAQKSKKSKRPAPKASPKPKKESAQAKERGRSLAAWIKPAVVALRITGPPALTLVLIGLGGWAAWSYATSHPRFLIQADQLMIERGPAWLSQESAREINSRVLERISRQFGARPVSIFQPGLLRHIANAYREDAWVLRVESVSRYYPNIIRVRLVLRRPMARVRSSGHTFIVDKDGKTLACYPFGATTPYEHLPVVNGLRTFKVDPGGVWQDEGLHAVLDILNFLHERRLLERLALVRVDVSNFKGEKDPRESEIVLVRSNNIFILWGRAMDRYGEISPEKKAEKLETLLAGAGDVPGVSWNIRFSNGGLIATGEPAKDD